MLFVKSTSGVGQNSPLMHVPLSIEYSATKVETDQTLRSAASGLGLHDLPKSHNLYGLSILYKIIKKF